MKNWIPDHHRKFGLEIIFELGVLALYGFAFGFVWPHLQNMAHIGSTTAAIVNVAHEFLLAAYVGYEVLKVLLFFFSDFKNHRKKQ